MYSKILTSNKYEYNELNHPSTLEEYIENISYGSKEALSKFYEITKTSIYAFALSILKNSHDAEDVLQDVYIKIYENASAYQANGKPLAWILTITKNLSLMKLRKQKNNQNIDELLDILPSNNKNDAETRLLLYTTFQYITDEERNILILHAVAGFKHREIAKLLGIPLSTVLSKYNRTIKRIKKIMSEENQNEKERN